MGERLTGENMAVLSIDNNPVATFLAEPPKIETTAAGFDPDPPTRAYVDTLKAEIAELRGQLARFRSDRSYVVGFNDGAATMGVR